MNNMEIRTRLPAICLVLIAVFLLMTSSGYANQPPWHLHDELGLPDWLHLSGEHRTRYETLDEQFRAKVNGLPGDGGDQAIVFRALIHAKIDLQYIRFGAEMIDSRIKLADMGSASSSKKSTTSIANPLELLQAYVEVPIDDLFIEGSQSMLRGGRITMDLGSRRLVARNRFRNTINSFTGVDWLWQSQQRTFRAFYTLPVQRLVRGDIDDNHAKFDREHGEVRFWGMYYSQPVSNSDDLAEFFLLGLNERDVETWKTKDRDLYTFGMRFWHKPKAGEFDYQFEAAYQLGESRSSKKSTKDLDHWAHFHHAELGYSFAAPWSPRLVLQYDYASGDKDSKDQENNRFDTLYGARRFDFGPTSIYGPFIRSNLNSPALRLFFKPEKNFSTMIAVRGFWRASTKDAWTEAGIKGEDIYIGTQVEARLRWDILPKNIRLEGGVAHIFAGDLMASADKKDTTYAYTQAVFRF